MEAIAKILSKILLMLLIIAIDVYFSIYKVVVFYNSTENVPVYNYTKIWSTIAIVFLIKIVLIFLFIITSRSALSLDYWVSRWIICFLLAINIAFVYDIRIFAGNLEHLINIIPLILDIAYIIYFVFIFSKHIIVFLIKRQLDYTD